jgi:DamX protein
MEQSKNPDARKTAARVFVSLDKRISALEFSLGRNQESEAGARGGTAPAIGAEVGELDELLGLQSEQLAELAAAAESDRSRMRDLEVSLVGRIADVDDDRRRTASALQRALDAHTEEMKHRVRRKGGLALLLAFLAILVSLCSVWFAYSRGEALEAGLSSQLAEVRQEVARVSAVSPDDDLLRGRLRGLAEVVSGISETLETLTETQGAALKASFDAERAERGEADRGLSERLERLEGVHKSLAEQIDALRSAIESGSVSSAAGAPGAEAGTEPEGRLSPDHDSESVEEQAPVLRNEQTSEPGPAIEADQEVAVLPAPAVPSGTDNGSVTAKDAASLVTQQQEVSEAEGGATMELADEAIVVAEPRYALQLIGLQSLDALRRFADRDDLPEQVYYRQETFRGKPWYVLIHSLHSDWESAAAARATLPADLSSLDVWIRPLDEGSRLQLLDAYRKEP